MTKSVIRLTGLAGLAVIGLAASGCEAKKSENPLSPNIAGPIAGVSISVPAPVSPLNGTEIENTSPVRLTFANSSTNGVRPLWYVVELASDSSFANKLYTNGRVTPAEGAQTSVTVNVNLTAEATYFWRVRADDGANNSEFSQAVHFDLVVPVSLGAPSPVSPANGETTASRAPTLTVNNGTVTGRAGTVIYFFEIATDQAFSNKVATMQAVRGSGTTSTAAPELAANTLFFWRAWPTNGAMSGPVSATQSFRTPAAAPGGGGGGGGVPPPPAGGFRTPDPPPGQRLPLPNMFSVVQSVASQYPGALANSCQDHGGTWEFMDRLVNELRRYDTRWGYNWKRGNVGDPSLDVVAYHWGSGPDEGSSNVYLIDVIGNHCGANPSPSWGDVTDITYSSGFIGRWTSRGRF